MQLTLIPDDEMSTKSRRTKKEDVSRSKMAITKVKIAKDAGEKIPVMVSEPPTQSNMPSGVHLIIKKIYFAGDTYSKNQKEFKEILAEYGLVWVKNSVKSYTSKTGAQIMTGTYSSNDGNKKVFGIYEGSGKPATMIIKILGTGGNFLISLQSFCHKVGCRIEDKDELYINNVLLLLHEKGEIYIEKKLTATELEQYQKEFEEKVQKYTDIRLAEWMDASKESLVRRGFHPEIIEKFRRREIEDTVRWALQNGMIQEEKEWSNKWVDNYGIEAKEGKEIEKWRKTEEGEESIKAEIGKESIKAEIGKENITEIGENIPEIGKNIPEIGKESKEIKEIRKETKEVRKDIHIFYKEFDLFIRESLSQSAAKYIGASVADILQFAREKGLPLEDGVQGIQKFLNELTAYFKSIGIHTRIKDDFIYFENIKK